MALLSHLRSRAKKISLPGVALLLAGLLTACVDEIDLGQAANLDEGIVLQGSLRFDGRTATVDVKLERLFSFASNRPDRIASATVTLESESGARLDLPYRDGTYQATFDVDDPGLGLAAGVAYRILATTREGRNFASEYERIPEAVAPTGLRTVPITIRRESPTTGEMEDRAALSYRVSTPSVYPNGAPLYLRFRADQTFALSQEEVFLPLTPRDTACYITRSALSTEVAVLNGATYAPGPVTDAEVYTDLIDYRYALGSYARVYQEAINAGAYQYFNQVATLGDQSQSIFTNPPGPVTGNVYDVDGITGNVFGYFYAANVRTIRVGVTPAEADNPDTLCPFEVRGDQRPPLECTACAELDNSTIQKPDYWEFW